MQSTSNIPWNVQPRNGFKSFFTEESYTKWFGRESHEARLVENLQKAGITLQPGDLNPSIIDTKQGADDTHKSESEESSENLATHRTIVSSSEPVRPRKNPVKLTKKLLSKSNKSAPAQVIPGGNSDIKDDKATVGSGGSKDATTVDPRPEYNQESIEIPGTHDVGNYMGVGEISRSMAIPTETLSTQPKTESEVGDKIGKNASEEHAIIGARTADFSSDHTSNVETSQKSSKPVSGLSKESAKIQEDGNAPRPNVLTTSLTERPSKEEIKKLMADNILYFNNKDSEYFIEDAVALRSLEQVTDKYIPKIAEKRPRKKTSVLLSQEQKLYFELHRKYRKSLPECPTPKQQDEIDQYKKLGQIIQKEQKNFIGYLRYAAGQCEEDYLYMHPEAENYISTKLLSRRSRVWAYPRYYKKVSKFSLPDDAPDNTPTLQYIRPLLELGSVCRMVLPSIIPGCPQPCTPTSYSEISPVCPPIRDKVEGPLVWHHEECSRDINIEQLAVPNKCDISLSACTLKHLIDNQGYHCKYWHIPVTVREYNLTDGDQQTTHRVIYLDKPLIRTSEYTKRDKNLMFQKYALRSVALRPRQKVVVFSRIKPISTVQPAQGATELSREISDWENSVKASSNEHDDLSTTASTTSEESSGDESDKNKLTSKRWPKRNRRKPKERKRGKTEIEPKSKGVGVFDIEKDLDDLETFGMDKLLESKANKTKTKTSVSPKKTETRSKRTSVENELELLKQELQGIKSLAKKDVEKKSGGYNFTNRKTDMNLDEDRISGHSLNEDVKHAKVEEPTAGKSTEENALVMELQDQNELQNQTTEIVEDTGSGNVEIDEQTRETVPETKPATSKVGKLSVKNVSSLSSIMKRMTTVKAKLLERNEKQQNSKDATTSSVSNTNVPVTFQPVNVYSTRTRTAALRIESLTTDGRTLPTDSDTDTEGDELVIDIPVATSETDTLESYKTAKEAPSVKAIDNTFKAHETIESPPASPEQDIDTPESPSFDAPQSPDMVSDTQSVDSRPTCVMIPLVESNNEEVIRDYSSVKFEHVEMVTDPLPNVNKQDINCTNILGNDNQNVENLITEDNSMIQHAQDSSPSVTRGSKRRSSEMKGTVAKRFLRSSVSNDNKQKSTEKGEDSTDMDSGIIDIVEKPYIVTRGRGRQCEAVTERITRSRSASVETKQKSSTSPATRSRKSTRHSLDSVSVEVEVPIKRRKGRQPKSSAEESEGDIQDVDKPQDMDADDKDHTSPAHPVTKDSNSKKGDDSPDRLVMNSPTSQREIPEQPVVKRRGRPPKITSQDFTEAKKMHEMAEAMKKKLADRNIAIQHTQEMSQRIENTVSGVVNQRQAMVQGHVESVKGTDYPKNVQNQDTLEKSPGKEQHVRNIASLKQEHIPAKPSTGQSSAAARKPDQTGETGLESILSMQTDMLKPTTVKSLAPEQFASQHGMQRSVYPVDGNVTYHQWSLRDTNFLVRCSYHGHTVNQGIVHLSPKMEYQPYFGFERETVNETARNWISVYVRPNSSLARTRINPFNSEVMMLEHVNFTDLIPPESGFKSLQAFADLDTIAQNLKSLLPGQYLLQNNPSNGKLTIMEATEVKHRTFDLHRHHASFTKGRHLPKVQWVPVDTNLLLPHHKRMQVPPCLYKAKDEPVAKFAQKKKGKKNKRKNKKPSN